jgi:hypothetical protein
MKTRCAELLTPVAPDTITESTGKTLTPVNYSSSRRLA